MKIIQSIDQNFIELSGQKKAETGKAILFFDGKIEVWLPKSQIEDIEDKGNGVFEIIIPEWLAESKDLI